MCRLFHHEFKHAAEAAAGEKVTRFFKLFPLVGRTDVVPEAYGCYVCQGVAARARDTLAAKRRARNTTLWGRLWRAHGIIQTNSYIVARFSSKLLNTTAGNLSGLSEKQRGYAGRLSELGATKLESDVAGVVDVVVWGGVVWSSVYPC